VDEKQMPVILNTLRKALSALAAGDFEKANYLISQAIERLEDRQYLINTGQYPGEEPFESLSLDKGE
jgi:hypothetical protein